MSTSAHLGRLASPGSQFATDEPFRSRFGRQVVNNALHYADEQAQVRVTWCALSGQFLTTDAIVAGNVNTYLPISTFGPFPVAIRADDTPYIFRVRLHGSSSAANSVTFRAALAPIVGPVDPALGLDYAREQVNAAGTNVLVASTSSTTPAWLAASGGATTRDADDVIVDGFETMATVSAAGASARTLSVDVPMLAVHVWAASTTAAAQPRLSGLYYAEYVGT